MLKDLQIHIWKIIKPAENAVLNKFMSILSPDELLKFQSYHFEADKCRYLRSRLGLRMILSRYCNMPPKAVEFHYSNFGKPYLPYSTPQFELNFNVSHSSDCTLIAIAAVAIGIDVEALNDRIEINEIAKQFFSDTEYQKLQSLKDQEDKDNRLLAFYRCWTRKEAFIKALGEGLSFPLNEVEVTVLPDEDCRILSIARKDQDASLWKLFEIIPEQNYLAAVALQSPQPIQNISYFEFDFETNLQTIQAFA